jgi:hypothetical protein
MCGMWHTDTDTMCGDAGLMKERLDVHAVYVSEGEFDVEAEGKRLKTIMDKFGNVNIFISEVRASPCTLHLTPQPQTLNVCLDPEPNLRALHQ